MVDRRFTMDNAASSLNDGMVLSSTHYLIHDDLGFHKICAPYVSRMLFAEHKKQAFWHLATLTGSIQRWMRRIFERNSDLWWNVGSSERAENEMSEYSVEKLGIVYQEMIQDSTINWKSDANSVLVEESLFLWFEINPNRGSAVKWKTLCMTRVLFGANPSPCLYPSPYLLCATIKHHISK